MRFPEKYIKRGDFELHSGQRSDILYDVNALLTDEGYIAYLLENIPLSDHYIGIATGGAIIAALIANEIRAKFSMIHDGQLKGKVPLEDWMLIDDVITTGRSLEEAIRIIEQEPSAICVAIDRREENRDPEVYSIFEK